MRRLIMRTLATAVRLPVALAWDAATLGNFGGRTSTEKLIAEHQQKKANDDVLDLIEDVRRASGGKP